MPYSFLVGLVCFPIPECTLAHYPLDIVGGIFVGCLSAIVAYLLLKKLKPSAIPTSKNTYALRDIYLIAVVLLLSVGGVALGNYFCFG